MYQNAKVVSYLQGRNSRDHPHLPGMTIYNNSVDMFCLILFLFGLVFTDLPIDCQKHQVVGRWLFDLESKRTGNPMENTCGHSQPSTASTAYRAKEGLFKGESTLLLDLRMDGTVSSGTPLSRFK